MKGRLAAHRSFPGIETGIVGLAPMASEVTQMTQQLNDGEFDVFYGPIRDTTGTLRVPAGENLTDHELFDQMGWYVEGVVFP